VGIASLTDNKSKAPPLAHDLPRRNLLWLLLVVAAGWGVGQLIQRVRPIGSDLGQSPVVLALRQEAAPATTVASADLTLVVFTDYRCPACRASAPALEEAVARDGRVGVVYREWPIFGPPSERAARVAIAAARQGVYPALHRRLMAERRPLDDAVLRDAVEASGGQWPRVEQDLRDRGTAIDAQIAATRRYAATLGIAGTPAYLAGSILVVGALDRAGFAAAFARARGG
jgi:protein-disulfide isomerase